MGHALNLQQLIVRFVVTALELSKLVDIAKRVRLRVVKMIATSKSAHIGSSFSIVELLVSLYFKGMNVDPKNITSHERDRFLLSKGHGCAALYATLVERGFATDEILDGFAIDGGTLWGHSTWKTIPGIEASTGSLGHGLSIGVGMAIAGKLDECKYKVFVLLGDGECDEGSVWEAILFAGHKKLDNLVAIVDYNKIQSFGKTKEVIDLEPFAEKWKAANWSVREVDGHDIREIVNILSELPFEESKPSVIIAHTVKGKGVSYMERSLDWHYKSPNDIELKKAIGEINAEDVC